MEIRRELLSLILIKTVIVMGFIFTPLQSLSLPEAQEILLQNSRIVTIAEKRTEAAKNEYGMELSNWYPKISFSTNYTYVSETGILELPGPLGSPIEHQIGDHDRTEIELGAVFPIFTGLTRYHSTKSKKYALESQKLSEKESKNQLSLQLALLFFSWELVHKKIESNRAVVQHMKEYNDQKSDHHAAGAAVKTAVSNAEAQRALANMQLLDAQIAADSIKNELLNILEVTNTNIQCDEYPLPDSITIERLLATEMPTNKIEFQVINKKIASLKETSKAVYGHYFPTLLSFAGYRYADPGLNMGNPGFMGYGLVGIELSWTLYDGFATRSRYRAMRNRMEILEMERDDELEKTEKSVQTLKKSLSGAYRRLKSTSKLCKSTDNYVEDLDNMRKAGMVTSLDYAEALSRNAHAYYTHAKAQCALKTTYTVLLYTLENDLTF